MSVWAELAVAFTDSKADYTQEADGLKYAYGAPKKKYLNEEGPSKWHFKSGIYLNTW